MRSNGKRLERLMTTYQTFSDLQRGGYRLDAYCRRCSRHEQLDMSKLSTDRSFVGARLRCRQCGRNDETNFTIGAPVIPAAR